MLEGLLFGTNFAYLFNETVYFQYIEGDPYLSPLFGICSTYSNNIRVLSNITKFSSRYICLILIICLLPNKLLALNPDDCDSLLILTSSKTVQQGERIDGFSFPSQFELSDSTPLIIDEVYKYDPDKVVLKLMGWKNNLYTFSGPDGLRRVYLKINSKSTNLFLSFTQTWEVTTPLQDVLLLLDDGNNTARVNHGILEKAFSYVNDLYEKGIELNIEHIRTIHLLVSKLELKEEFLLAGIMRGDEPSAKVWGGETYYVDISRNEVGDFRYSDHQGKQTMFAYTSPGEVRRKLTDFLEHINSINRISSNVGILKLVKDYLKIHPTHNANGRVAEVLNYYLSRKYGIKFISVIGLDLIWTKFDD